MILHVEVMLPSHPESLPGSGLLTSGRGTRELPRVRSGTDGFRDVRAFQCKDPGSTLLRIADSSSSLPRIRHEGRLRIWLLLLSNHYGPS